MLQIYGGDYFHSNRLQEGHVSLAAIYFFAFNMKLPNEHTHAPTHAHTNPDPYPTIAGPGQLPPVLPPISPGPTLSPITSHSRPLISTKTFPPTNDPPTYEQASFESQGSQNREEVNPPDYYKETGRVRREEEDQGGTEGEAIDMSQYMSSEEIHVAAMEGVKTSTMKKLVSLLLRDALLSQVRTAVPCSPYCSLPYMQTID